MLSLRIAEVRATGSGASSGPRARPLSSTRSSGSPRANTTSCLFKTRICGLRLETHGIDLHFVLCIYGTFQVSDLDFGQFKRLATVYVGSRRRLSIVFARHRLHHSQNANETSKSRRTRICGVSAHPSSHTIASTASACDCASADEESTCETQSASGARREPKRT